jgi:transposase
MGTLMKRYIEGADRSQSTLFPESLDDYISEDNPVRVIDVFVEELDLAGLGFDGMEAEATGRPSYHPATLLKIYIYGYLNRVQSSRRLERETQRNVELMWLTGRLAPDFKTIADFRKDNGLAIRRVCSHFIVLCRGLDLFSESIVAIDGSKFKAANSRGRNYTQNKVKVQTERLEERVAHYLEELDRADQEPSLMTEARVTRLKQRLVTVKERVRQLAQIGKQLEQTPGEQISLTDPDCRAMVAPQTPTGMVGYNVQTAVDTKHHLIVAHEVSNKGHDRLHLAQMAIQAQQALGQKELTVLADRGYYKGEEIRECAQQGITALVPKPQTSSNRAHGLFDKSDFRYIPQDDEYQCPAGQRAIYRFTTVEHNQTLRKYWSSACPRCAFKHRCTTGVHRRITRWEHEDVLDAVQSRLDRMPEAALLRKQTVEHVFGTFKYWMGAAHFQTRTLPKVNAEMSLHVLAYNMNRVIKILGVRPLMQAIAA